MFIWGFDICRVTSHKFINWWNRQFSVKIRRPSLFFFFILSRGLYNKRWSQTQSSTISQSCNSLTASHRVNSVHSVMLSVHFFEGLPLRHTPSAEPGSTFFANRSSGMRQIWPKSSSFLRRIMSITVSFSAHTFSDAFICLSLANLNTPSMFLDHLIS